MNIRFLLLCVLCMIFSEFLMVCVLLMLKCMWLLRLNFLCMFMVMVLVSCMWVGCRYWLVICGRVLIWFFRVLFRCLLL